MLSEDSESGGLPSCSEALFVLVPKLKPVSKLPKLNPSFSTSGTWRWLGIITFSTSEMCDSSNFFCRSLVTSFVSGTEAEGCDRVLTSTGTVETPDEAAAARADPWARLLFTGFGFHSLQGPGVEKHRRQCYTSSVNYWTDGEDKLYLLKCIFFIFSNLTSELEPTNKQGDLQH